MPSPQRVPPAEPVGASLTSHLAAALLPPVADDASIQRVRVRATLTPLGMLQPQKLKVVKPLVHLCARAPQGAGPEDGRVEDH